MKKILIICGPTATGKTNLGVYLAKKFRGEIVSADSRQVYRGMDILTGKDLPLNSKLKCQNSKLKISNEKLRVGFRKKEEIPIWLVDIVEPDYFFNVGEYSILAKKVIKNIWLRRKLPIVVGGTGLYIASIIRPMEYLSIPPDFDLRKKYEFKEVSFLQKLLSQLNPEKWRKMNQSDKNNPRRLIRAIEIALWLTERNHQINQDNFLEDLDVLKIGLKASLAVLKKRIEERIKKRIKKGVIEEVKKLFQKKYSLNLPSLSTTGYGEIQEFLVNQKTLDQTVLRWKIKEVNYAKRQMTWFKKEEGIVWFDISKANYQKKVEEKIKKWYTIGQDEKH